VLVRQPTPVRAAATTLATAAVAVGLAAGPAAPAGAIAPDTLFPTQGNPGYDVDHYDVRLDYAPATNHLAAVARLRATAAAPLSSFHLDLSGMRVAAVRVDGRPATWRRSGHELVVTPAHDVAGTFTTSVAYAGVPREHTDPDGSTEGWVRTSDGATALGEPVGTMTWLPCDNTPADKATYSFRVRVPRGVVAAANGDLVRRQTRGAHTTWVWRSRDPMSTYLATVAIGHFDVHRSSTTSTTGRRIPIWSFVDPTSRPTEQARALLPEVIAFEERHFGAYPFTSAGMIVDDADVGYALETQTRPFYPGGVGTGTLVHETAHQWYGDSVTLTDWHDIWLAEGFATYAEWLWDGAHGGPTPAEHFDDLYATPADDDLWHPAPTEFTDPADLFGSPGYDRGAMTLQALRERIGGADFARVLRAWAAEHRHGNARTADLVALAERISGKDLTTLFHDWLELDGRPAGY
jgi:aminopeptidase N